MEAADQPDLHSFIAGLRRDHEIRSTLTVSNSRANVLIGSEPGAVWKIALAANGSAGGRTGTGPAPLRGQTRES